MNKKKMISVRVEGETLAKIDDFVCRQPYRNRSMVINGVLSNIFNILDENTIFNLIAGHYAAADGYTVIFRYVKKEAN